MTEAALKQAAPPKINGPFVPIRYGSVPDYEGLTLHQIVVWEYLNWRKWDDGLFQGRMTDLAEDVHMHVQAFRAAVAVLVEQGKLHHIIAQRGRGTLFVFPEAVLQGEMPLCQGGNPPCPNTLYPRTQKQESTPCNPPEKPDDLIDLADEFTQKVSAQLVDEWDRQFPQTVPGAVKHRDQQALYQLLTGTYADQGKGSHPEATTEAARRDADQIRAYMAYLERTKGIPYCLRPYKLLQRVDQGRGPYKFADLEVRMNATSQRGKRPPGSRRRRRKAAEPPVSAPAPSSMPAITPTLPLTEAALQPLYAALQRQVAPQRFETWFQPTTFTRTDDTVTCWCTSDFMADWIYDRLREPLQAACQQVVSPTVQVRVAVAGRETS